jgi:hypothetical protein
MWRPIVLALAMACPVTAGTADLPHPRLWITRADEPAIREKLAKDPLAARLHQTVLAEADRILTRRTCQYEIPDGKRLLRESRLALHQVSHCAWAWRFTGRDDHRRRAIAELDAACSLKDWNPAHFLDTAEMATAVALGYDWLHHTLSETQRQTYRQAIIDKALQPAQSISPRQKWWSHPSNNWSQVCGAGISLAAAAIAGHDDRQNTALFTEGLKLVEACSQFYQPDGMYPEGPGYWHYGTNYHVLMLAACKPLGIAFRDDPVLCKAGLAMMHLTSPTRLSFNFADGGAGREIPTPAQSWIASHYRDAVQARHVRSLLTRALDGGGEQFKPDRHGPLAVAWLPADPGAGPQPMAAVFRGEQPMALFRNGWHPGAAWLGIKGGTAAASHGHMDAGAFVFDAHGERWFHDLGAENYNLPGYFGGRRWEYYRLQNRSHNTLEIAGLLQNPKARPCPLLESATTGRIFSARFDLSDAYRDSAARVIRSATFDSQSGVSRIEDVITSPKGGVVWRAFTDAKTEIRGNDVILTHKSQSLTIRRISPTGVWSVSAAKPPTPQENPNTGFQALTLTVPAAESVAITVELRP